MSIIYTFECNTCGNKITTREQECKHKAILEEANWNVNEGSHTCRECRPTETIECVGDCGNKVTVFTDGEISKALQLLDKDWVKHDSKWFCDDCHRESIF